MKVQLEYGSEPLETEVLFITVGKHTYLVTPSTNRPNGVRIMSHSGAYAALDIHPVMGNVLELSNPSPSVEEWEAARQRRCIES